MLPFAMCCIVLNVIIKVYRVCVFRVYYFIYFGGCGEENRVYVVLVS